MPPAGPSADPQADPEIVGLTADSRAVLPGFLFAALPGSKLDGRAFAGEALRRGAVAILTDDAAALNLAAEQRGRTRSSSTPIRIAGWPSWRRAFTAGSREPSPPSPAPTARPRSPISRARSGRPRPPCREPRAPSASSTPAARSTGALTTPDPVASTAISPPWRRRDRACRARGVEPRSRPVPSRRSVGRRRRLHQSDPRPSRLSPRHGGATSPPRSGCSPSYCRRAAGVLNRDSGEFARLAALCRDHGHRSSSPMAPIRRRICGWWPRRPRRARSGSRLSNLRSPRTICGCRCSAQFQALNALAALGLAIATGRPGRGGYRGPRRADRRSGPDPARRRSRPRSADRRRLRAHARCACGRC